VIVAVVVAAAGAVSAALAAGTFVLLRRSRPRGVVTDGRRVLVPFTRGGLDETVLDAAIRIARSEDATLVPAYLIVRPLRFALDAPMPQQAEVAFPLLEAVEHAVLRARVPVDARVESGRTPTHALENLWRVEQFHRIVAPAPTPGNGGFSLKDLTWILANAPTETVILRPCPPPAAIGPDG
jgi:hypothetical protein